MPSAYLINRQSSATSRVLVTVTAVIVALLAAWTIVSIMMSRNFAAKPVAADIQVVPPPPQAPGREIAAPAPVAPPVVEAPPETAPPLAEPVNVGSLPLGMPAAFAEAPEAPPVPRPREMKALLDEIRIDPISPVPLPHPRPPARARTAEASAIPMPRPRPDLGEPEFVIEPYIARMQ
jgi:hypothetical protein